MRRSARSWPERKSPAFNALVRAVRRGTIPVERLDAIGSAEHKAASRGNSWHGAAHSRTRPACLRLQRFRGPLAGAVGLLRDLSAIQLPLAFVLFGKSVPAGSGTGAAQYSVGDCRSAWQGSIPRDTVFKHGTRRKKRHLGHGALASLPVRPPVVRPSATAPKGSSAAHPRHCRRQRKPASEGHRRPDRSV